MHGCQGLHNSRTARETYDPRGPLFPTANYPRCAELDVAQLNWQSPVKALTLKVVPVTGLLAAPGMGMSATRLGASCAMWPKHRFAETALR